VVVAVGDATGLRIPALDKPAAGDQTGVIDGQPEAVPFHVPEDPGNQLVTKFVPAPFVMV
jgi:hypothetical protein